MDDERIEQPAFHPTTPFAPTGAVRVSLEMTSVGGWFRCAPAYRVGAGTPDSPAWSEAGPGAWEAFVPWRAEARWAPFELRLAPPVANLT